VAQRTHVQLVDDLDGTELADGDGQTVHFDIDGKSYEIDLSRKNADKLRKALEPYVSAGRRTGRTQRQTRSSQDYDPKAVRKWAESNKVTIPARGRIPAQVLEQYRAAGN
jgi:hypothetical protein